MLKYVLYSVLIELTHQTYQPFWCRRIDNCRIESTGEHPSREMPNAAVLSKPSM